jgi:hypothetical protein
MFSHCGCDRAGPIGESGSLRRKGRGEGRGYSEVPRWSPLAVSIKDRIILAPIASFDFYWPHVKFYGAR